MSNTHTQTGTGKSAVRHTLSVHYWEGQEIRETFAIGSTKAETLCNWFRQYYGGKVPEGACLPSGRDSLGIKWGRI